MKQPSLYILSNARNTVLYIGVTSNLIQRVYQHKNKIINGFSAKYNLNKLVYFELHKDMDSAITREKSLKQWHRPWKERLIGEKNPDWRDLYLDII